MGWKEVVRNLGYGRRPEVRRVLELAVGLLWDLQWPL